MHRLYLTFVSMLAVLLLAACTPSGPIDDTPTDDIVEAEDPYTPTDTDNPGNPENPNPDDNPDEPIQYATVDVPPTFRGGDLNTFIQWVQDNLQYPQQAQDEGIQGRVLVQFVIDTDGSMTDIQLARGLDNRLNNEALRVVRSCQEKWTPGMHGGKKVKVLVAIPVTFRLAA